MIIEQRIEQLGLYLPEPVQVPPGVTISFAWGRVFGDRVFLSGHGPQRPDGTIAEPLGKVGAEVSASEAYAAARLATLSLLGTLKRSIGDLDRVGAWMTVSGFVNVAPGFVGTTNVLNGCSDLLLELFGPDVGSHARTAIGAAVLPVNCPVVIAAEVALSDPPNIPRSTGS
jgi:enamine deaminase RidA (YjgF/YER057c/UK114 family)